jgi:DNA processing protein
LTATAAIDYNREVFAVPGSIFSESSQGTNKLIKMGARPTTSFEDILESLNIKEKSKKIGQGPIFADTKEEEILLRLLKQPTMVDTLIKKSGLKASQVNSVLIEMEIKGKVTNLGGSQFIINGKMNE